MSGVKLHKSEDNSIPVYDMEDGQIGIITKIKDMSEYNGKIVQRCGKYLIVIGAPWGDVWDSILKNRQEECRVKILEPGTLIEIQ